MPLLSTPVDFGDHRIASTLVFPATNTDGQSYIEAALARGEKVFGATSERPSELSGDTENMLHLPYVYEDAFVDAFMALMGSHHVSRVYAPVAAVHIWLERFIKERKLPVQMIGDSPIKREMKRFERVMSKAVTYEPFIKACAQSDNTLSTTEVAAVFQMISNIYGESNDQKIAAMMAVFASATKGDVVEIGSLVGKSASVMALLAKRYAVGNFLAIDPWEAAAGTQHDSPDLVKVHVVNEWEHEKFPHHFSVNLYPVGIGHSNYIQMESEKGFYKYQSELCATTPAFGRVEYTGQISVIHIDGNHDFDKVALDCELWLKRLNKDGWLILDDYLWAHGDGPYRVGNALLVDRNGDIERSFVCGKALFVKFKDGSQRLITRPESAPLRNIN